ncbi:MAG: fructosamine kinase family protein [bacterium]
MTVFKGTVLSKESAELVLQKWLKKTVNCLSIKRLHGGMINSVLLLSFDQPPYQAVIKISVNNFNTFESESYMLNYLRQHTKFPVPKVYMYEKSGLLIDTDILLIEKLPGINLGIAQITQQERRDLDRQLADILIELHGHKRSSFGELDGSKIYNNWLDFFEPMIRKNYKESQILLTDLSNNIIPNLLDEMPNVFKLQGEPTLIHGDIWATNIIVDYSDNRWIISGLIDPSSIYADVEYELAYLEVFQTVTRAFFDHYTNRYQVREGYEIRRLYYWLNTLMLHVWIFKEQHYIMRTERIAKELRKLLSDF